MLDTINTLLRFLLDNPAIFFSGLGYFTGYLFRKKNLVKIIIAILLIPYSLELLVSLNWIWQATSPYLIFAIIGYLGHEKTNYYLTESIYTLKDLISRR